MLSERDICSDQCMDINEHLPAYNNDTYRNSPFTTLWCTSGPRSPSSHSLRRAESFAISSWKASGCVSLKCSSIYSLIFTDNPGFRGVLFKGKARNCFFYVWPPHLKLRSTSIWKRNRLPFCEFVWLVVVISIRPVKLEPDSFQNWLSPVSYIESQLINTLRSCQQDYVITYLQTDFWHFIIHHVQADRQIC